MKRADYIPDEELKRLLGLAEDAPRAITEQSKLAYECNREAIDNLSRELEIVKAEEEWDVNTAKGEDGKLTFPNATGRKSELERRLLKHNEYQKNLKEKSFLEVQRQQKFSQYYQDKDTFKAVLKKLGMAIVLQETENLTMKFQLIESERLHVEIKT